MKKIFALLPLVFVLSACEMYAESAISDRRVQVREENFTEQVSLARANNEYIAKVAHDYGQSGSGPVDLTITYDPQSRTNTAMHANDEAVRLSQAFRKHGVRDVVTSILPVREQGPESVLIISYSSYQAGAPANCGRMTGFEGPVLEHDPSYKLGCTVETVFARQIADPSDLLGDAKAPAYSDGRSAANIVDVQRSGAYNKPIKGEGASN
ncbi:MAG: CpaD family pilus assembly lipoprotein [Alphaproteobacteria bacterium]